MSRRRRVVESTALHIFGRDLAARPELGVRQLRALSGTPWVGVGALVLQVQLIEL